MTDKNRETAGALLFVGAAQFILAMIIAEAVYPGYSTSGNYISDLGVGQTAAIFNSSVFILGLTIVAAAYLIHGVSRTRLFPLLLAITGLGAMGVGIFPEPAEVLHYMSSAITFLFAALSAIGGYTFVRKPYSYFSVAMGGITLTAIALFLTENFLGVGPGGMERMIAYPMLLWAVVFGGYLIGVAQKTQE